ncbi:hypothetical protein Taro_002239, partial [Colocasia esculenta]|nr:hypothetical protein [Colocasia esculenta]
MTMGYAGGDEAAMLHRRLLKLDTPARIGVGANRVAIAADLLERYGHVCCNRLLGKFLSKRKCRKHFVGSKIGVSILDDGFQHWSLLRNMDIVMVNGMMPWGNGHLLPRGTLRECLDAIRRADIGVIHHADL